MREPLGVDIHEFTILSIYCLITLKQFLPLHRAERIIALFLYLAATFLEILVDALNTLSRNSLRLDVP